MVGFDEQNTRQKHTKAAFCMYIWPQKITKNLSDRDLHFFFGSQKNGNDDDDAIILRSLIAIDIAMRKFVDEEVVLGTTALYSCSTLFSVRSLCDVPSCSYRYLHNRATLFYGREAVCVNAFNS